MAYGISNMGDSGGKECRRNSAGLLSRQGTEPTINDRVGVGTPFKAILGHGGENYNCSPKREA